MADLDTLRPEVRRADSFLDSMACSADEEAAVKTIRAELLRLADGRDELRCAAIAAGAALEVAKSASRQAETELTSLKMRIADAPIATVYPSATKIPMGHMNKLPASLIGKRVRLVVEE